MRTFLIIILIILAASVYANNSASAIAFSGSNSLRASGSEVNYWNPANLKYALYDKGELSLFSGAFGIGNNGFSISRYNEINGTFLTNEDKERILKDISKSLKFQTSLHLNVISIAFRNLAISSGVNAFVEGQLSSEYIELILMGNEYDRRYQFSKENNGFNLLSYADLTIGFAPYSFEFRDMQFHTGVALSLLSGIANVTTERYDSEFYVSDAGLNLDQTIELKRGMGGFGFKSLLGVRTDIFDDLSLSFTVDNLFGFITWIDKTESTVIETKIDNVYLASLEEEIIQQKEETSELDNFTTSLPVFTRLGILYRMDEFSFSIDWKQGFTKSVLTEKTPELSFGAEYLPIRYLPLRFGYRPGLGEIPYAVSYGTAFVSNSFELGIGVQSVRAVFPSSYSRGVVLGLTSKWRF